MKIETNPLIRKLKGPYEVICFSANDIQKLVKLLEEHNFKFEHPSKEYYNSLYDDDSRFFAHLSKGVYKYKMVTTRFSILEYISLGEAIYLSNKKLFKY